MMLDTPTFKNPPIIELVIGAQFAPLTKLSTGHFGLFWDAFGRDEWTTPSDAPRLEDQLEVFDRPHWGRVPGLEFRLQPMKLPGRFLVSHRNDDRLIQLQATRFHLNWRKRGETYPSYRSLITDFETLYDRFVVTAERAGLGRVELNQWELTYVDAFPQSEYWKTPAEWSSVLPGLFGSLDVAEGLALESRAAEWRFEIPTRRGRLHIVAKLGPWGDGDRPALLLETTARGPIGNGGADSLRAGLDLGHDQAVNTFLRISSPEARKRWGETK